MAAYAGPCLADLPGCHKQPDVSRVGFAKESAKPVRTAVHVRVSKVLAELAHGDVGPPEEIRPGRGVLERGRRWRQDERHGRPYCTGHTLLEGLRANLDRDGSHY